MPSVCKFLHGEIGPIDTLLGLYYGNTIREL